MEKLIGSNKKFKVEVTETTSRIIEITAKSVNEAWEKVSSMYKNGEIVLNYNDYFNTEINII